MLFKHKEPQYSARFRFKGVLHKFIKGELKTEDEDLIQLLSSNPLLMRIIEGDVVEEEKKEVTKPKKKSKKK